MNLCTTIENVYQTTSLIISIGLLIAAIEDVYAFDIFRSNNLLSWKVSRLLKLDLFNKSAFKAVDFLLSDTQFKCFVFAKLLASLILFLFSLFSTVSPVIPWILFFLNSLIVLRSPYGLDGAHQMNTMILFGLSIGLTFGIHSKTALICIWFIAGQCICAYFVSGITKLLSPWWRSGHAIRMVFGTQVYGHPAIYNLANQCLPISHIAAWAVILFESLFPMILVLQAPLCVILFIIGMLFHIANAFFMGLNGFLFAFTAAYPSLIFLTYKRLECYLLIH